MTQAPAPRLSPFEFRATFDASAHAADTVSLRAEELAALLAEARAEGAHATRRDLGAAHDKRLKQVADDLRAALRDLADLAGAIDAAPVDSAAKSRSKTLIKSVCQRIIDGQGDLFADRK